MSKKNPFHVSKADEKKIRKSKNSDEYLAWQYGTTIENIRKIRKAKK